MPIVVRPTETDREFARWALMTFVAREVVALRDAMRAADARENETAADRIGYALSVSLTAFQDLERLTDAGRKMIDLAAASAARMMARGGLSLNEIEALEKGEDPCAG